MSVVRQFSYFSRTASNGILRLKSSESCSDNMEEPQQAQIPNTPISAQSQPPLPPKSKKRPLDSNVQIQNCKYFKMRAVLKDLRPHIMEVLRTPDFRDCKAAHEVREQMKLLMDLYKQLTAETVPQSQPFSAEYRDGQKPRDARPAERPPPDRVFAKPFENKSFQVGVEKQRPEGGDTHGTYIVGGSAFGWNFITFPGNKPVYYGGTKESFRAAQVSLQES